VESQNFRNLTKAGFSACIYDTVCRRRTKVSGIVYLVDFDYRKFAMALPLAKLWNIEVAGVLGHC